MASSRSQRNYSRRDFCRRAALLTAAAGLGGLAVGKVVAGPSPWPQDDLEFLRGIAADVVAAAHVPPGALKSIGGVNTTGIPLITPGGNYFCFWVRDFAMSLDCGLIGPEEILPQLKLVAQTQSGPRDRHLLSGATIPAFSIADHIRMDGAPIYVPGTDTAGQWQGLGPWGPFPSADDHFWFTHIAYAYWRDSGDAAFLAEPVNGLSILDRLIHAFFAVDVDPQTGAVVVEKSRHRIGFGFHDTIYMLGALCFVTLLRWRAARQLVELCRAAKRESDGEKFAGIAQTIADNLLAVFGASDEMGGWLRAATERCRQPDVWATLFALHLGVLNGDAEKRARETVAEAVVGQTSKSAVVAQTSRSATSGNADLEVCATNIIEHQGAVRHVPTTHDFSAKSAWEDSRIAPKGQYQNGAYWHTPTGWLIEALMPTAPELARGVFDRFIAHLRKYDYRLNGDSHRLGDRLGAPWECFGVNLAHAQNPVYMTSVTLPLAALLRMSGD